MKKGAGSGSGVGSGSGSGVGSRCMDPRIRDPELDPDPDVWIRGSGSAPKGHGSLTLVDRKKRGLQPVSNYM